jgi:hypothetical protein
VIRGWESREKLLLVANPGMLVEREMRGNVRMELGLNRKAVLVTGASRERPAAPQYAIPSHIRMTRVTLPRPRRVKGKIAGATRSL